MAQLFISRVDLESRFGVTTVASLERNGPGIAQALLDVNSLAEAYVGQAYALPLQAVPDALKGPLCDIARFRLQMGETTESVVKRYDDAMAFLRAVAAKRVNLGIEPSVDGDSTVQWESAKRVLTEDQLAWLP